MLTLTRPHRRHAVLTALVLVLGLVLAACGDDGVPQSEVDAMRDQVAVATERLDDLAVQLDEVQQDADGEAAELAEAVQLEIDEVAALLESALATDVAADPDATTDPATAPPPPATTDPVTEPAPPPATQ